MTNEKEISLKNLFWHLLSHWKSALVFLIAGVLLACLFTYLRPTKFLINPDTGEQIVQEKNEESSSLSSNDIALLNVYYGYKKLYNEKQDYIVSAEIMNLDANNVHTGQITYSIEAENPSEIQMLQVAYDAFLRSLVSEYGELYKYDILSFQEGESETENLNNQSNHGQITMYAYAASRDACEEIMTSQKEFLAKAAQEISASVVNHSLSLVYEDCRQEVNSTVATRKKNNMEALNTYSNGMVNSYKNLSDAGKQFADEVSVDDFESELQKRVQEKVAIIDSEENAKVIYSRRPEKKKVLLGALLGLFAWLFLFSARYAISDKLRAEDDVAGQIGAPLLGFIRSDEKKKTGVVSAAIDRARHKNYEYASEDESISATAIVLSQLAKKAGHTEVLVSGSNLSDKERELVNRFSLIAKENGVTVCNDEGLSGADELKEAAKKGAVVLVEIEGKTDYSTVRHSIKEFSEMGVTVVGLVVIE